MICAAERMPPKKAYLELDDQPPTTKPYTPIAAMAKTNSTPVLTLDMTHSSLTGITAHTAKDGMSTITGAKKYIHLFALSGTITSLSSSLNTSANGWIKPHGPVTFGPTRSCM